MFKVADGLTCSHSNSNSKIQKYFIKVCGITIVNLHILTTCTPPVPHGHITHYMCATAIEFVTSMVKYMARITELITVLCYY